MDNVVDSKVSKAKDSLFSPNFSFTLRKEFAENRKGVFVTIGSVLGACVLLGANLGYFAFGGNESTVLLYAMMFLIIGCVAGSLVFSKLKTKSGRISELMLPDTQFDKFLIRWIAVVPVLFVIIVAGYYIGELSRIFVFRISNEPSMWGLYNCNVVDPWSALCIGLGATHIGCSIGVCLVANYFLVQAIYILGSVLWPKLSFIKTFCALWVLQTVEVVVMVSVARLGVLDVWIPDDDFFWWVAAGEIVVTLLLYYLSYLRYKRYQAIYKLF